MKRLLRFGLNLTLAGIFLFTVSCKREVDGVRIAEDGLLRVNEAGLEEATELFYDGLAKMDLKVTSSFLSKRILYLPDHDYYYPEGFAAFYEVDYWRTVRKLGVIFKWNGEQVEGFLLTVEFLKEDLLIVERGEGSVTRKAGQSLVRSDLWLNEGGEWRIIPQEASSNLGWVVLHDPEKLGAITREIDMVASIDAAKAVIQEREKKHQKVDALRRLDIERTLQEIHAKHQQEKK